MAYQANKPAATDQLSASQVDLQGNFQAIASALAKDHYAFGTANEGKHIFNQAAAPTVATATQVGIYCAALGGNPELYVNKSAAQIPFTVGLKAANGYTVLPSGIIMKWGSVNINGNSQATATFAVGPAGANFTVAPTCQITLRFNPARTSAGYFVSATTTTVTAYNATDVATTFYYLAIGY